MAASKNLKSLDVIYTFKRREEAVNTLRFFLSEYQLCQRKTDLESGEGACFHYHLKTCLGACIGEESPESYNERVDTAIARIQFPELKGSFILMEQAKTKTEQAVFVIENGIYKGFGYINTEDNLSVEDLMDSTNSYQHNLDVVKIIKQHIKNNRMKKIDL